MGFCEPPPNQPCSTLLGTSTRDGKRATVVVIVTLCNIVLNCYEDSSMRAKSNLMLANQSTISLLRKKDDVTVYANMYAKPCQANRLRGLKH